MGEKRWYAADALGADLANHHHHIRAASEAEVERRMRKRYPKAAAILQLVSAVLGFIAVSLFWIFSGILLLIGAALAFFGRRASPVTIE